MRTRLLLWLALTSVLVATAVRTSPCADDATSIFVMHVDGSQVRRVADVEGFPLLGSPRWSHDGKRLAFDAAGADPAARRWYVVNADGSGLRVMGLGGHPDWSPDDKQLVFAIGDNAAFTKGIWVQNVDGRGRALLAEGGQSPRWSPRDGALALANSNELEILDLVDSTRRKPAASAGAAAGFDWSPDAKQLALVTRGTNKNELWVVDVPDARKKSTLFAGDVDGYLAWSPDGKRLAISHARQIHLLNADGSGEPRAIPGQEGNNRMPAWSSDGQWIAFASTRKTPLLAPVAPTNRVVRLEELKRHSRGNIVYGLDLSLDGRQVLLGGKQDLEIWNIDDDSSNRVDLRGEWVSIAPDGHTVAQCGPLIKIAIGDLKTGKPVRDLHTGSMCLNVEFSPDGKRVVAGTIDKQVMVFDVASGKRVSVFNDHRAPITRVAFLPNNSEVASNGQDKMLRIWDAQTAKERLAIAHPEVAWGLAVSPDGRLIATGTGGPTEGHPIAQRVTPAKEYVIRLFDAGSGELVRELHGHTDVVYSLVFSPDGRTLASGGWDATIRVWDVATGRELASVQGQGSIYALAVTPDFSTLVAGGGENRSAGARIRRFPDEQVRVYRIIEDESAAQGVPSKQ
jgi:WD40 repeat protein